MNRRIAQLVFVLGAVAACNRDKEPASLTQQPPADSVARPADPTKIASGASKAAPGGTKGAPAGTKGAPAATKGAPTGSGSGAATKSTSSRTPAAGGGVAGEGAHDADLASAARLWTVQVGSFADPANATGMRDRLAALGIPVWTSTIRVGDQQFTRVRVGVTTNTADVRALAEKLRNEYRWTVWLAMVEDKSAVPSDMLGTTRAYAGQ